MPDKDKFQILSLATTSSSPSQYAVIERNEESVKETWSIYIPNAGGRNAAVRVARLLNEEHQRLLLLREAREREGYGELQ